MMPISINVDMAADKIANKIANKIAGKVADKVADKVAVIRNQKDPGTGRETTMGPLRQVRLCYGP
jgi:hypothetical protein